MSYIKFQIPDKLKEEIRRVLTDVSESRDSKIRKGMNEVTKCIERANARLVLMAEDVSPPEILFHVPLLCEEKGIPYGYLSTKKELGHAAQLGVGASAIAIEKPGSGNEDSLQGLIKKLEAIKK